MHGGTWMVLLNGTSLESRLAFMASLAAFCCALRIFSSAQICLSLFVSAFVLFLVKDRVRLPSLSRFCSPKKVPLERAPEAIVEGGRRKEIMKKLGLGPARCIELMHVIPKT